MLYYLTKCSSPRLEILNFNKNEHLLLIFVLKNKIKLNNDQSNEHVKSRSDSHLYELSLPESRSDPFRPDDLIAACPYQTIVSSAHAIERRPNSSSRGSFSLDSAEGSDGEIEVAQDPSNPGVLPSQTRTGIMHVLYTYTAL